MDRVQIQVATGSASTAEGLIHVFRTDGPVVANAPVIAKTENIAAGFEIKNISGAVEIRIGEPCAGVEQAICQFVTGDQLKARDPSRLVVPPVAVSLAEMSVKSYLNSGPRSQLLPIDQR